MIIVAFFLIVVGATCKSPEMVAIGFIIGGIMCLLYFFYKVHLHCTALEYLKEVK